MTLAFVMAGILGLLLGGGQICLPTADVSWTSNLLTGLFVRHDTNAKIRLNRYGIR